MNGKKKTIRIARGQEDRAIIECIYQENLFFQELYEQARNCTNEILRVNEQVERQWENKRSQTARTPCAASGKNPNPISYSAFRSKTKAEYYSCSHFCNLIAFCADRGQGKTSAMLSYATALSNIQMQGEEDWRARKNKFWEDTLVGNAQYEVLRSIDPTEMEPEDSILKIVLSQMYVHFQTVYEQECDNTASSYSLREQLAGQLQEKFLHCFHLADLLNDDKRKSPPANAEDEMEFISETGGGVNFRKVLCELFEEYLFFITGGENSYLVIPIDDADLNIGRVYSMLEDIRKYLQLPRIIILTATNITQLESIVEQHFLEEYGTALKHPHSMVDIAKCHHIAESYLEKILPGSRRLYLPSLYDEVKSLNSFRVEYIEAGQSSGKNEELDLLADEYAKDRAERADWPGASGKERWDYQEELLYLLHKKTGLLFMPVENELYPFLPTNMRELMHLLAFLNTLPDVKSDYREVLKWFRQEDDPQERHRWMENLRRFQRYLVDIWSASNLSTESKRVLTELDKYTGWEMHRYLLQILPDYYAQEEARSYFELESKEVYRQRFINECEKHGVLTKDEGHTLNGSSYRDVCTALNALESCSKEKNHRKFVCALQFYYAVCLHRLLLENLDVEFQNHEPRYYTDFLRGSFLGESGKNEKLPFGLWQITVPAKLLKVLKDDKAWDTKQWKETCSRWFRCAVEQENGCVMQSLDKAENEDDVVWVFQPFYPLLAYMDGLTGSDRKNSSSGTQLVDIDTYLSLIILLNPDVQKALWQNLREGKSVAEQPKLFMMGELFPDLYNSGAMNKSWYLLEKVNDLPFAFEEYDCFTENRKDLGKLSTLMWTREFRPLRRQKVRYDLYWLKENEKDSQRREACRSDWDVIQKVFRAYEELGMLPYQKALKDIENMRQRIARPNWKVTEKLLSDTEKLLDKLYGDEVLPEQDKTKQKKKEQEPEQDSTPGMIDITEAGKLLVQLLFTMKDKQPPQNKVEDASDKAGTKNMME